MTNWITRLAHASNGRVLTPAESESVAEYVESLPDRLAAARKLDESQKWLVKHLSDYIAPRAAEWGLPKDPFANDFAQCLTAVAHAMVCNDKELLKDSVITPYTLTADALEVPRGVFAGLFDSTWQALSRRLDSRSAELLVPFFSHVVYGLRVADGWTPSAAAASAYTPVEV
jgi:hypothetical protein